MAVSIGQGSGLAAAAQNHIGAQRLQDARDAVILAARRLSHGRRRDGAPRVTIAALERALAEAVDAYEALT